MGVGVGAPHPEGIHGGVPGGLPFGSDVGLGSALAVGEGDDLVVDVCDVGDEVHLEAGPLHVATQYVEHERHSRMAEVRRPVDRWAAHVHADLAGLAEFERLHGARDRVVEANHAAILPVP